MKKILAALLVCFGSTASLHAQESQGLICSLEYSGIESSLASEVTAVESALNNVVQNLTSNPNGYSAKIKFWEDYSREFKIADDRLESLLMYVDHPSRSMTEIRDKFIEVEAEINVEERAFKDTQKGNQAKWSIRKDFLEYKLNNLRVRLSTLRKVCKEN